MTQKNYRVRWKLGAVIIMSAITAWIVYSLLPLLLVWTLSDLFHHLLVISVVYSAIILITMIADRVDRVYSLSAFNKDDTSPYRFHFLGPIGDDFLYTFANGAALYGLLSLLSLVIYPPTTVSLSPSSQIIDIFVLGGVLFWLVSRSAKYVYTTLFTVGTKLGTE